jgi:hypothetical protein
MENGYLRLLARNSNKPGQSEELSEQIQESDADSAFETFATDLMEYVGHTSGRPRRPPLFIQT